MSAKSATAKAATKPARLPTPSAQPAPASAVSASPDPTPAERRELVDEYGALTAELAPLTAKIRRREQLGKIIQAWYENSADTLTFVVRGERYVVVVGAKGIERKVANKTLIRMLLGEERFVASANFTLKYLEANLNASELRRVITSAATGPRPLTAAPVEGAAAA